MSSTQTVLNQEKMFKTYEKKFKALSDEIRLKVLNELNQRGQLCVGDLTEIVDLPQSKLSYHLEILLEANLIKREKIGTWNYYCLNNDEVKLLLSAELTSIVLS